MANTLGIDICFEDLDNPIELFKKWFSKAEQSEINDPNAVAVATSDKNNQPNVRMVLLKGLSEKGLFFILILIAKRVSLNKIKKSHVLSLEKLKTTGKSDWKSRRSF